jgi:hypothetical protein
VSKSSEDIKIDKVIRSKRKTVSLEVRQDGKLVVRAPHLVPRTSFSSTKSDRFVYTIERGLDQKKTRIGGGPFPGSTGEEICRW